MYKLPADRSKEFTNHRGTTFTFDRSYNVHNYTYENQIAEGIGKVVMKNVGIAALIARFKCLKAADKETDMTMVAIEKDDEYEPEFKTCVTEKIAEELAARNENIASIKAQAAEKGLPEPTHVGFEFTLPEEKSERIIENALDMIKLAELKDHDRNMYTAFKQTLRDKYGYSASAAAEE